MLLTVNSIVRLDAIHRVQIKVDVTLVVPLRVVAAEVVPVVPVLVLEIVLLIAAIRLEIVGERFVLLIVGRTHLAQIVREVVEVIVLLIVTVHAVLIVLETVAVRVLVAVGAVVADVEVVEVIASTVVLVPPMQGLKITMTLL